MSTFLDVVDSETTADVGPQRAKLPVFPLSFFTCIIQHAFLKQLTYNTSIVTANIFTRK